MELGKRLSLVDEDELRRLSLDETLKFWGWFEQEAAKQGAEAHLAAIRTLCLSDRYYQLVNVLNRPDALHEWLHRRCREVESAPDGYLDLWAREHYKSTIITFAGVIQEIERDPEITIGIFSHTRPIAFKFWQQVRSELERNAKLKAIFPDIFWQDPNKEAYRWSEAKGIAVKRQGNPKEATLEAWGLVDGQPTGAHFKLRVYDDVVTRESVTTPDQIAKTTEALALSDNLGMQGGREWYIGTRYAFGDTYQSLIERDAVKTRVFPATDNGLRDGKPVFLPAAEWDKKKRSQTPSTLACQMLQNPAAGAQAMFDLAHLRGYEVRPHTLNVYIVCDPASSRKKGSDSTAIVVWGVDANSNKYLLDGYHHKMNLKQRWQAISGLRKQWSRHPGVQLCEVGYEKYGMQSDIEYFEECMEREGYSFHIRVLAWPSEGPGSKMDRMQRLYPDFADGRIFIPAVVSRNGKPHWWRVVEDKGALVIEYRPFTQASRPMLDAKASGKAHTICKMLTRINEEGQAYDLTSSFIEEYRVCPFGQHDDLPDGASRIYDMDPRPPIMVRDVDLLPRTYADS